MQCHSRSTNTLVPPRAGKGRASKLRALVGVEDFGLAVTRTKASLCVSTQKATSVVIVSRHDKTPLIAWPEGSGRYDSGGMDPRQKMVQGLFRT